MTDLRDLSTFARLSVRLSRAGPMRDEVLTEAGLDEDDWAAAEAHWAHALEAAERDTPDAEGVPPLVAAFSAAFVAAQADVEAGPDMSFERYVALTQIVQRGGAVDEALAREGATLGTYLRAHAAWTARLSTDPELAQRFTAALTRR
ncbi:MAG: hypothetical protein AAGN82_30220 [Myxococcota bacterium]